MDDDQTEDPTKLARRDDPVSSKMAAETVVERGVTEAHRKLIYAYLRQCGVGMTSNELASVIGLRGDKIQKRMAELEREGLVIRGPVRSCRCGLPAHEWRVAGDRTETHEAAPSSKPLPNQLELF